MSETDVANAGDDTRVIVAGDRDRYIPKLVISGFLLFAAILFWNLDRWYQGVLQTQAHATLISQLYTYENALSLALNSRLALLSGFKALVELQVAQQSIDIKSNLDDFAATVMGDIHGIRAFQTVHDGVITYTYPMEGNEQALGYNLLQHESQEIRGEYKRTIKSGSFTISGPVELLQGGQGLIARQSVRKANGELWGSVAIVLDVPELLGEAGLDGVNNALSITLMDTRDRVFYGSASVLEADPIIQYIELPDRGWTIAAVPTHGWLADSREELFWFRSGYVTVALLLAVLIYLIVGQQQRLQNLVNLRTLDLVSANIKLRQEIDERNRAETELGESRKKYSALSEKLSYQQSHDSLTGLVNREEFERRLDYSLTTAQADDIEHALIYIDVRQLNVINDLCGYVAGDELLRQVARELRSIVRQGDVVGRVGGGEFAILLENCTVEQIDGPTRALIRKYKDRKFIWQDESFPIALSIGMVRVSKRSTSVSELFSIAHTTCHLAKRKSGSNFHVYDDKDTELGKLRSDLGWVAEINKALDSNRFVLYYQKITPVGSAVPGMHYEILVRMQREDGSIIPPGMFLPAADKYQLTDKIDQWVLRNVLGFFSERPELLNQTILCDINISAQTLTNPDALKVFLSSIEKSRVPPEKLCFEVTETAAIENMAAALNFIAEMRKLGCKFALDDFGSGMSSFGYLKNLPVDYVKIDGRFVRNMNIDPVDREMVKTINSIAHIMVKATIAEFVENSEILESLQQIGVDYAQGYGIAVPEPLSALA